MKIRMYPVINLPDFLQRLYCGFGNLGLCGKVYGPNMPGSLKELQREYSNPRPKMPKEDWHGSFFTSGKMNYLRYLDEKLPKRHNVFEPDRTLCNDVADNFMLHEYTGAVEGILQEEIFVPECSKCYLDAFDMGTLPDDIMESKLVTDEGTAIGDMMNSILGREPGIPPADVTLGIAARPLIMSSCKDGTAEPHKISGVRHGNNLMISYGVLYGKATLMRTSFSPMPDLKEVIAYNPKASYEWLVDYLTGLGLHEWYHVLGIDHHEDGTYCVMDVTARDPFEKPKLEMCRGCESKAVFNAAVKFGKNGQSIDQPV